MSISGGKSLYVTLSRVEVLSATGLRTVDYNTILQKCDAVYWYEW